MDSSYEPRFAFTYKEVYFCCPIIDIVGQDLQDFTEFFVVNPGSAIGKLDRQ
jgi:hypothetical protein